MDFDTRLAGRSARLRIPQQLLTRHPGLPWLAAALLTLPALWPLLHPGFFVSDDGSFHVYRIAALADAWRHGVLYPRLFPAFGFGYGQAVLNFYAPLAYVPGALLASLNIGPASAAQITLALGFVLGGLAAYGFVSSLWGALAGLLAAVAYTYFPYHLADAYIRGAIPEQLAFIWPPLILWAYTLALQDGRAGAERDGSAAQPARRPDLHAAAWLWSALAWAGLIYTHNLTALMFVPVAAAYLVVLGAGRRRRRALLLAAGSFLLSLLLSAPLWLPYLTESRAVGLGLGPSDGYRNHLAPLDLWVQLQAIYRYRVQHGGVADHPLSWLSAALFVATLVLGIVRRVGDRALMFGLGLALVSACMITAPALPVWRAFEAGLAQLQYPWRFLTMAALGTAIVSGGFVMLLPRPWQAPLTVLAGLLLMAVALPGLVLQPLDIPAAEAWAPDRMWHEDAAAGQVGATWTGEFLPQTVREQRWALGRPLAGAVDAPVPAARPGVVLDWLGYAQTDLTVTSAAPMSLRLHQFYLPGWGATIDGQPATTYATGELGLVTLDVPAGTHRVAVGFGPTPARAIAALLATLGAVAWAVLAWWVWRNGRSSIQDPTTTGGQPVQANAAGQASRPGRQPGGVRLDGSNRLLLAAAGGLLLLALALNLNRAGAGQRGWTPQRVQATLGDVALLVGYDVAPAHGENAVDVTLYWLALRDTATNYKAFVHLTGANGQVLAQHDGDPGGGYTPTTRWRAGEVVPDRHRLPLPDALPAGELRLKAGLYSSPPVENLTVDPPTQDKRVDLGAIRLPDQGGRP